MTIAQESGAYLKSIGEIVKTLRVASGMTPEELAASAQLSSSFIRKLEGGARGKGRDITLETAKKLADGLGVSPAIFFEPDIPKTSPLLVPPANPQAAKQLLQWSTCVQMGIATMLEENERLRVLADAAPDGIIVLDKGKVLFVNRSLLDMLGLTGEPDQLAGFDLRDLNSLMKYVAPGSLADAHRSANDPSYNPFIIDLVRTDGSSVAVWIKGKDMEYDGRNVHVAILRDVSWQDEFNVDSEDYIDWEEALPDLIAGGMLDREELESKAVIFYTSTKILWANSRAADLVGFEDPKELIGRMPLAFVSPGSLTGVLYRMPGNSEGAETIDAMAEGNIFSVFVRWQTISYRGAAVRVGYITELKGETKEF